MTLAKKARLEGLVLRLRWVSSCEKRSLQLQVEGQMRGAVADGVGVASGDHANTADTGKHAELLALQVMVSSFNDVSIMSVGCMCIV